MRIFNFRGGLEGLLTVIARGQDLAIPPGDLEIRECEDQALGLFDEVEPVDPDRASAERLMEGLRLVEHPGLGSGFRVFLLCSLSRDPRRYDLLYRYCRVVFGAAALTAETGFQGRHNQRDTIFVGPGKPEVLAAEKLARVVIAEVHRFQGLARFRETSSGLWYAPVNPDNDIAALLAPHFAQRFPHEDFMIHDVTRNLAYIHGSRWKGLVDFSDLPAPTTQDAGTPAVFEAAKAEEAFQKLWKLYYQIIAIKERKNPVLRRRFVPRRYWRYLPELENLI